MNESKGPRGVALGILAIAALTLVWWASRGRPAPEPRRPDHAELDHAEREPPPARDSTAPENEPTVARGVAAWTHALETDKPDEMDEQVAKLMAGLKRRTGAPAAAVGPIGPASRARGSAPRIDPHGPTRVPKGSWDAFGLCRDDSVDAQLARRAQLIKAFVSRKIRGVQVFMDPSLHDGNLLELARELLGSKDVVDREFGTTSIPLPEVFVYRDVEAMQHWLCVHGSAVAYYDGSMHVVMQGDWRVSILHEYVHHELAGLSIAGPMWFHEGEAMRISKEDWWDRLWRAGQFDNVIPFDQLIAPHLHDTSEAEAVAYYGQARLMVSFLWWLNDRQEPDQINALHAGSTDAAGLFAWSAHIDDPALQRAFTEFVQTHGDDSAMQAWERRYVPAERLQLLERAREQHGRQPGP